MTHYYKNSPHSLSKKVAMTLNESSAKRAVFRSICRRILLSVFAVTIQLTPSITPPMKLHSRMKSSMPAATYCKVYDKAVHLPLGPIRSPCSLPRRNTIVPAMLTDRRSDISLNASFSDLCRPLFGTDKRTFAHRNGQQSRTLKS